MKYCKKCTMPDTRPGITFDENGVCSACNHYAHRKDVDWDARWKEFEAMCDKYRGCPADMTAPWPSPAARTAISRCICSRKSCA